MLTVALSRVDIRSLNRTVSFDNVCNDASGSSKIELIIQTIKDQAKPVVSHRIRIFRECELSVARCPQQTPLGNCIYTILDEELAPMLDPRRHAVDGPPKKLKPYYILTITDGAPTNDAAPDAPTYYDTLYRMVLVKDPDENYIFKAIEHWAKEITGRRISNNRGKLYAHALSFVFGQVGLDKRAQEFLGKLDEDKKRHVGQFIDCVSTSEVEQSEAKKKTGEKLAFKQWICKLLLGGISDLYDSKDESKRDIKEERYWLWLD